MAPDIDRYIRYSRGGMVYRVGQKKQGVGIANTAVLAGGRTPSPVQLSLGLGLGVGLARVQGSLYGTEYRVRKYGIRKLS